MFRNISILFVISLLSMAVYSQNWTTNHGNNENNGISKIPGPQSIDTPIWTITDATYTGSGTNIYSFGDRFVNSRVGSSPYSAIIECRYLTTGELVWVSPDLGVESILYLMGFNEDAVYAHDYNSELFYSLNPVDGSINWVAPQTSYIFARTDGAIFTCERNIIINGEGSGNQSTICLDKETGEIIWANSNSFSVTPNSYKAAHDDKLYMIIGAWNQPKQLVAVDINTGENLYVSEELPGGSLQQGAMSVSPDGTIYVYRDDGADIFAIEDSGSGFNVLWTYTPVNMGSFVFNHSMDYEGNPLILDNGKVYRLARSDGSPMDSSLISNMENGRITIDSDSVIYVNNYNGRYFALSYDLQTTIWEKFLSSNYDAGPAFSKNGIMVMVGSGFNIFAYQYEGEHAPVSDFISDNYLLNNFGSVNFTDQSSFQPTSWHWEFPGAIPSSSTEQNPSNIQYNIPGVYDVTLIAYNTSGSDSLTKQCLIEVLETTEIVEYNVNDIRVYPNPTNGIIKVESEKLKIESIEITDITGKIIFNSQYRIRNLQPTIDISNQPSGIYFIEIQTNNEIIIKKIIKN